LIYQQAIEPARQAKTIAKSLEGAVTLEVSSEKQSALAAELAELEEFFIVSELNFSTGPELKATVIRSGLKQCARCWRRQPTVGADAANPDLCDRCAAAVSNKS
jgi:isoleucyl-tRNA synthetase